MGVFGAIGLQGSSSFWLLGGLGVGERRRLGSAWDHLQVECTERDGALGRGWWEVGAGAGEGGHDDGAAGAPGGGMQNMLMRLGGDGVGIGWVGCCGYRHA